MIISDTGLLYLNQFSSLVKLPGLTELTAGVDYTIESNSLIDCSIVSSTELLLSSAISAEQGQGVLLQIGDFYFKNIIDNIDDSKKKIILTRDILDKDNNILESGNVKIKVNSSYIITLNSVDEGHYMVKPSNKKIVVRKSWVQPFVSYEDLTAELVDIQNLKESRLMMLNRTELKKLYSDLSGLNNYYDIIDEIDLWDLLYLRISCVLKKDNEQDKENSDECDKYKDALKTYEVKEIFIEDTDGKPSDEINNEFTTGGWSL